MPDKSRAKLTMVGIYWIPWSWSWSCSSEWDVAEGSEQEHSPVEGGSGHSAVVLEVLEAGWSARSFTVIFSLIFACFISGNKEPDHLVTCQNYALNPCKGIALSNKKY